MKWIYPFGPYNIAFLLFVTVILKAEFDCNKSVKKQVVEYMLRAEHFCTID
jgi:hypothetical protein